MTSAAHFLMIGDSGDVPTIRATLRRLPVDAYGQVFVEIASAMQIQDLPVPAGMSVTWLRRDAASSAVGAVTPRGELVARAVAAWVAEWMPEIDTDQSRAYVLWIGCSASERVDRLYHELTDRIPNLHLHHPHHDS